jgi:hypothetical protein
MHFGRQVLNLGHQQNLDSHPNKSSTWQKKDAYVPAGTIFFLMSHPPSEQFHMTMVILRYLTPVHSHAYIVSTPAYHPKYVTNCFPSLLLG